MDQNDGEESEKLAGYEGDTGSGSDGDDPSSDQKAEWHLEMQEVTTQPLSEAAAIARAEELNGIEDNSKPASNSSVLVMGYHTIYDLENTDLPLYVKEHATTLTFPEKVRL